jgi:hypothetical protein
MVSEKIPLLFRDARCSSGLAVTVRGLLPDGNQIPPVEDGVEIALTELPDDFIRTFL